MKKRSLTEFYTDVLSMVNIDVVDGFLKQKSDDGYIDITRCKGMSIILPIKELMDNMYVLNKNNKFTPKYLLFNPLSERITEDNIGLEVLIDYIKVSFSLALIKFGEAVLHMYTEPKLQSDLPMVLNKFIQDAKDETVPGMKTTGRAVDDRSIKNWTKLITNYARSVDKDLFSLVIPRTKKVNDDKSFNREARLLCNLVDDLKQYDGTEENIKIMDTTLRPKDVKVFQDILNIFMVDMDKKGVIKVGSNDNDAPGFIALMGLFYKVAGNYSLCLDSIKDVDKLAIEEVIVNFKDIDIDDINKASITYKNELMFIPTEADVNLGSNVANSKKGTNLNTNNLHPTVRDAVEMSKARVDEVQPLQTEPPSAMDQLLGRRNIFGIGQPVRQYNVFGMQQPMNQPVQPMQQPLPNVNPMSSYQQPNTGRKMVSLLSPQYNTPEGNILAQQQIMASRQQNMQPTPTMPMMGQIGPVYGQQQMGPGYMGQPMMPYQQPMQGMNMYQPQMPNMGLNVGYVPNNNWR